MRLIGGMLLALLVSFGLGATAQQTTQLTQVPPKPTCTVIFNTGTCADLWRNYNQALAQRQQEELQLYVNRQKQLASEAATAPLQKQVADLNKLTTDLQDQISKLQKQMQADSAAALEARAAAHQQGMWYGSAIGVGATFFLFAIMFAAKRFTHSFTISRKSAD